MTSVASCLLAISSLPHVRTLYRYMSMHDALLTCISPHRMCRSLAW